jgi:hypothetical protein
MHEWPSFGSRKIIAANTATFAAQSKFRIFDSETYFPVLFPLCVLKGYSTLREGIRVLCGEDVASAGD